MSNIQELSLMRLDLSLSPARVLTNDGQVIAKVYLTDETRKRTPDSIEMALRLVECWNALLGVSTPDVAAMALDVARRREALRLDEAINSNQEG